MFPSRKPARCAHRSFATTATHPTGARLHLGWRFLLLGSASLLAVPCHQAHAGLNSGPEFSALQAIYTSTDGANWTDSTGWGSGDACSWFGITCDQDTTPGDNTSHVVQVYLSYNNLNGSIADLTELIALQDIQVDNNLLTGSILVLTGLISLRNFDVHANLLTGSIPALTALAGLQYVSVDDNQLTGGIPALIGLANLRSFTAPRNQLTGAIPDLTGL